MIQLPVAPYSMPTFRVLSRREFQPDSSDPSTGTAGWTQQPMAGGSARGHGFEVVNLERVCLPQTGRATLRFHYGAFAGGVVGCDTATAIGLSTGSQWDSATHVASAPDLGWHEVLIQVGEANDSFDAGQPESETNKATTWRTVFWGQVVSQEDNDQPGAGIPAGTRTYHLADALFRLTKWPIYRHWFDGVSTDIDDAIGIAGYNSQQENGDLAATVSGNRGASCTVRDVATYRHKPQGKGDKWTEAQALTNAMACARQSTEPMFTITDATGILAAERAIEVRTGDTVFDLVKRICDRSRGKGVAFLDWSEAESDDPVLSAKITITPQVYSTITYTKPSDGSSATVNGAYQASTYCNVDLIGDHRAVADDFRLTEPEMGKADYVETQGERIQVAITADYVDSTTYPPKASALQGRWSATDHSTFVALDAGDRVSPKWHPIWQLHGLPFDWAGTAGDGNGGTPTRVDYRCSDTGAITQPTTTADTSPLSCRILDDLPFLSGYDYSGATPSGTDDGNPQRRPIEVLLRLGDDAFLTPAMTPYSCRLKRSDNGLLLEWERDADEGRRLVSDTTDGNNRAIYNIEQLAIVCTVELPHRVRLASGTPSQRRKTVTVRDMHLWLADYGAIHALGAGDSTDGYAASWGACGATTTTPGILRDDRDALARIHAFAWQWYGETHRTATWALKDFGIGGSFDTETGSVNYPTIGQVVHTLSAGGQQRTIDTPITRIFYDAIAGKTTWSTDWSDLDVEGLL